MMAAQEKVGDEEAGAGGAGDGAAAAPEAAPVAVSFREVLRTADAYDKVLMLCGTVCGAACGSVQPWCVAPRALPHRPLLGLRRPTQRAPTRATPLLPCRARVPRHARHARCAAASEPARCACAPAR
jgi:hypothetical protein